MLQLRNICRLTWRTETERFLMALAKDHAAPATQNQAFAATIFILHF
jgi:hypothetical protein